MSGRRRPAAGVALSDVPSLLSLVGSHVAKRRHSPRGAAEELYLTVGLLHALLAAVLCKVRTRPAIAATVVAPHPRPFHALRLRVNLDKLFVSPIDRRGDKSLRSSCAVTRPCGQKLANHAHPGDFQSRCDCVRPRCVPCSASGAVYPVHVLRDGESIAHLTNIVIVAGASWHWWCLAAAARH